MSVKDFYFCLGKGSDWIKYCTFKHMTIVQ